MAVGTPADCDNSASVPPNAGRTPEKLPLAGLYPALPPSTSGVLKALTGLGGLVAKPIGRMAESDPTKDPEFQKVICHFLRTPSKQHKWPLVSQNGAQ